MIFKIFPNIKKYKLLIQRLLNIQTQVKIYFNDGILYVTCNDENNNSQIVNFIKSTKSSRPTSFSGATILPTIGNAFMYIEISSNKNTNSAYVILERTDIIQITNIAFYYNTISILTINSVKSMGRFRVQLLLERNTWTTKYQFSKNSNYSSSSTERSLLNIDFTEPIFGIRLYYDKIDTAHADMCFSNITITHSVY